MSFSVLFRTINAGKTPHKNEDQSVAGMFCLNVSNSSCESDDDNIPMHVMQVYYLKGGFLIQYLQLLFTL